MFARLIYRTRYLVTALGASVATVSVVYLASADNHDDVGAETAATMSFSGRVTAPDGQPLGGNHSLRFVFKRPDGLTCSTEPLEATADASTGAFTVGVPLDACPTLFDGTDVTFSVEVDGAMIVSDAAVRPVPYAKYADRVGSPGCPVGYVQSPDSTDGKVICERHAVGGTTPFDVVVKVGYGAAAFWIDRYEASVWDASDGTEQYGTPSQSDYPVPATGQIASLSELQYAASRPNVPPSAYLTWFQAQLACAASGKRLPTNAEWTLAAAGTPDPQAPSAANDGTCRTSGSPRNTGGGNICESVWGAQDMIGNVSEMLIHWDVGVGDMPGVDLDDIWTVYGFGSDRSFNVASAAYATSPQIVVQGMPSMVLRGGDWGSGETAGIAWLNYDWGVTVQVDKLGFRCVIPG